MPRWRLPVKLPVRFGLRVVIGRKQSAQGVCSCHRQNFNKRLTTLFGELYISEADFRRARGGGLSSMGGGVGGQDVATFVSAAHETQFHLPHVLDETPRHSS